MTKQTKIALDGFEFEAMPIKYMGNNLITHIRNNAGKSVGKFMTSGIGLDEHQRRFKAVIKKTVRRAKGR